MSLPEHGQPKDQILEALEAKRANDVRWQDGRTFGMVYDLEQGKRHTLPSEHDGIVLVQRTFPRVRSGESVGVVLDLSFAVTDD